MMTYAVKAEAHDGQIYTLRDNFPSKQAAGDFKIVARRWRRFWIERVEKVKEEVNRA